MDLTRRRLVIPLVALGLVLGACSSDGGSTGENGNEVQTDVATAESEDGSTAAFCDAAERAVEADEGGDAMAAADLLQPFVEALPEEAALDLRAYVDELQAANPNPDSGDAEGSERAADRFRTYVDERCGG